MISVAFVTGGTGFLGRNLVEALLARGVRVVAPHRPGADVRPLRGAEAIEAPLLDPHAVLHAMPERCDVVFHLAASTSVWRLDEPAQIRSNVEVTRNVVAAALERRARRFVHCSSEAVYGLVDGTIDETCEKRGRLGPTSYHGTKYIAERIVLDARARGLQPVVVAPAHVLGPYDRGNWARLIRMVDAGTLPAVPQGAGSFCDARDVAAAMIAAATHGRVGESYLLGGHDLGFPDLVRLIAERLGRPAPTRRLPEPLLRLVARLFEATSYVTGREPRLTPESLALVSHRLFVRSDKAARELGYRCRPIETTLDDAIAWLRSEGLLASHT